MASILFDTTLADSALPTELVGEILSHCDDAALGQCVARLSRAWCARAAPLLEARLTRGLRWEVRPDPHNHRFAWIGQHTAGASYVRGTSIWLLRCVGEIYDMHRCTSDLSDDERYDLVFSETPSADFANATPLDAIQPNHANNIASWRGDSPSLFGVEFTPTTSDWMVPRRPYTRPPDSARYAAFASGTYTGHAFGEGRDPVVLFLIDDWPNMRNEVRRATWIAERAGVIFTWV